jgi:hypothetical protein
VHFCGLRSRTLLAQLLLMKKFGKDLLMFAEACRTRGFRRDLAFNMVVPLLVALLYFEARSDFEVVLVWWLFVAAVLSLVRVDQWIRALRLWRATPMGRKMTPAPHIAALMRATLRRL